MRSSFRPVHAIGIGALLFVVGFFLLLPYYLGPDDLRSCDKTPEDSHINDNCHQADAIVALSGGDTKARTLEAVKLYQAGWASKLIFSGAAQDKSGPSNAQAMKQLAIARHVDAKDILIEESSVNTQQNAAKTQALIKDNNLHRIILVTSAYHQRRANLEFTKRAGNDITVISHPVKNDSQWQRSWYLTLGGWWLAVGELVKILSFYLVGAS